MHGSSWFPFLAASRASMPFVDSYVPGILTFPGVRRNRLHAACSTADEPRIRQLLNLKMDPNGKGADGERPLAVCLNAAASEKAKLGSLRALIGAGADVSAAALFQHEEGPWVIYPYSGTPPMTTQLADQPHSVVELLLQHDHTAAPHAKGMGTLLTCLSLLRELQSPAEIRSRAGLRAMLTPGEEMHLVETGTRLARLLPLLCRYFRPAVSGVERSVEVIVGLLESCSWHEALLLIPRLPKECPNARCRRYARLVGKNKTLRLLEVAAMAVSSASAGVARSVLQALLDAGADPSKVVPGENGRLGTTLQWVMRGCTRSQDHRVSPQTVLALIEACSAPAVVEKDGAVYSHLSAACRIEVGAVDKALSLAIVSSLLSRALPGDVNRPDATFGVPLACCRTAPLARLLVDAGARYGSADAFGSHLRGLADADVDEQAEIGAMVVPLLNLREKTGRGRTALMTAAESFTAGFPFQLLLQRYQAEAAELGEEYGMGALDAEGKTAADLLPTKTPGGIYHAARYRLRQCLAQQAEKGGGAGAARLPAAEQDAAAWGMVHELSFPFFAGLFGGRLRDEEGYKTPLPHGIASVPLLISWLRLGIPLPGCLALLPLVSKVPVMTEPDEEEEEE